MDAVSLTIQDHRTVEELFGRFEKSKDPQDKRGIVDSIIEELSIHAAIEEELLYPPMRELPDGDDLVIEAIEEHLEAKVALAVLAQLSSDDPAFQDKAEELIAEVRHHVEEEEQDLLPRLREALGEERLADLGRRMEEAKKNAPTRPSAAELAEASGEQLYEAAQSLGLAGRSDMDKDELVKALAPS